MDANSAVAALSALAHASRLALFRHLVARGPEGALPGDLAPAFELPPATLSFHLKTLSQAGLLVAEKNSRNIRYRANFREMQALIDFLMRDCCGGNPRKCAPDALPKGK